MSTHCSYDVETGDVVIGPAGGSFRLQCLTPIIGINFLVPSVINKTCKVLCPLPAQQQRVTA